jgi:hypothetical protein
MGFLREYLKLDTDPFRWIIPANHNRFLYTRWFNAKCFGLMRSHHQANKTQKKLWCTLHNTISCNPHIWLTSHLPNRNLFIRILSNLLFLNYLITWSYDRQTDTHTHISWTKSAETAVNSDHIMSLMLTVKMEAETNIWVTKYRIKRKTMYWHITAVFCTQCLQQYSVGNFPNWRWGKKNMPETVSCNNKKGAIHPTYELFPCFPMNLHMNKAGCLFLTNLSWCLNLVMNLNEPESQIHEDSDTMLKYFVTAKSKASDHLSDEQEVCFLHSDYTEI